MILETQNLPQQSFIGWMVRGADKRKFFLNACKNHLASRQNWKKRLNIYSRQGYNTEIVEYGAFETFLSNWRPHYVSSIMSVHCFREEGHLF